jgi:hypothetical protein
MVDLPFHNSYKNVGGGTEVDDDACLSYNTGGLKTVALSPRISGDGQSNVRHQTRGTAMNFQTVDLWVIMWTKFL